jgi:hypothetical protein
MDIDRNPLGEIQMSKFRSGLLAAFFVALVVPFSAQADCILNDAEWDSTDGGCLDLSPGGLVWSVESKKATLSSHTYAAAVTYCNNLVEGGFDDWRLPTKAEMVAISFRNAATHLNYSNSAFNWRWTSTPGTGANRNKIWAVKIGDGSSQLSSKQSIYFEFCVRQP